MNNSTYKPGTSPGTIPAHPEEVADMSHRVHSSMGVEVAEVSPGDHETSLAEVQAHGLRVLWAEPLSPARRRWLIGIIGSAGDNEQ